MVFLTSPEFRRKGGKWETKPHLLNVYVFRPWKEKGKRGEGGTGGTPVFLGFLGKKRELWALALAFTFYQEKKKKKGSCRGFRAMEGGKKNGFPL